MHGWEGKVEGIAAQLPSLCDAECKPSSFLTAKGRDIFHPLLSEMFYAVRNVRLRHGRELSCIREACLNELIAL